MFRARHSSQRHQTSTPKLAHQKPAFLDSPPSKHSLNPPNAECSSEQNNNLCIPRAAAMKANVFGLVGASLDQLSLLLHSPKRSHSEPGKRHGETNCNHHPPRSYSSGLVLCIFVRQGDAAKASHREENKPCYLKPKLVQDAP